MILENQTCFLLNFYLRKNLGELVVSITYTGEKNTCIFKKVFKNHAII